MSVAFIIANHRIGRQHKTCPAAAPPNTLRAMQLLDRYLFRELLAPWAVCLIGIQAFVAVFTVFSDAQKIQDAKLHFGDTIEYAAASAMDFIPIVLPISLLLALLITLTHYARHNEITAMRAAGVSLWRICAPYFAVGLAGSAALFALNESLVPRGADRADQILHRYVPNPDDTATQKGQTSYFNAHANRLWKFTEFHPKTTEMISPKVSWTLPDGKWLQVQAERAVFTNGVWFFFNAASSAQLTVNGPLVPMLATNVLAMPEFKETPKDMERDIRFSKYERLNSRKLNIPLAELWAYLQAHPELPPDKASLWRTKFDGRLAAPWTCLVVVLIAIPFGAASGRRNLFFGVAGSIFICFGFFVIQQFSLAFGSGGYLPAWLAAWLPNMIFGGMGLLLTARVR
jgi:lipopolysaccharide export system permease protein